jgi:hypothetical protein
MLPRLTLALNVAVLVCSAAAYAQQRDLASLASASRASSVAAPRFVNIGNEIIQSQTARPIPPPDIPAPPQSTAADPTTEDVIPEAAAPSDAGADMTSTPVASDAEIDDVDPRLAYAYPVVIERRPHSARPGPVAGNPGDNPAYWPNYTRTRIMKMKRGG